MKKRLTVPLVSIITATYNADDYLEQSIKSVLSQTYPNIEYIVMDGCSKDNTLSILRSFEQKSRLRRGFGGQVKVKSPACIPLRREASAGRKKLKFYWKSEKDRGIADAFNKGIRMSHGDYIYFFGAGDVLKTPHVISQMMERVDSKKDMIVCGRIERIKQGKRYEVLYTSSLRFFPWMLLYKMALPHPGMFMHRNFFTLYGHFDIRYKYAMDYELLLRAYRQFPKVVLKNIIVDGWREGGIGQNKRPEVLNESHLARVKNRIAPLWMLWIIHVAICVRYVIEDAATLVLHR
jgi:glycosyltransferase involved in cell wall biosynthesis